MLLLLLFALIAGVNGTADAMRCCQCCRRCSSGPALSAAGGGRSGSCLGWRSRSRSRSSRSRSFVQRCRAGQRGPPRTLAVVVLIGFGIVMLVPALAQRVRGATLPARTVRSQDQEATASGPGSASAPRSASSAHLAPARSCRRCWPISATTGPTVRVVLVAVAYVTGLSTVLLLYGLGGRKVLERIKRSARGDVVERVLATVLIVTGIAMAFNLDVRFEDFLANSTNGLPTFLTDPTSALENSNAVQNRLVALRPESKFFKRQQQADRNAAKSKVTAVATAASLPGGRRRAELHQHAGLVQHPW